MRPGYSFSSQPVQPSPQPSPSTGAFTGIEMVCLVGLITFAFAGILRKHYQEKILRSQVYMLERIWQLDCPKSSADS